MKVYDSSEIYLQIKQCRTCESEELSEILDLGMHPLANSLLESKEDDEVNAPLVLIRCNDCTTIQLSINVKPELMFQQYLWVTGTTETARNHCLDLAKKIVRKSEKSNPRVLEIGSNDGTLLSALIGAGALEVIGVDPASNLQPKHLGEGIRLVEGFFGDQLAETLSTQLEKVDVVVARNVLSHVPNLNDVMRGIERLIKDDGVVVIEFHEASKILTELHYDSIYHEHTFYHSINSVQAALNQIGFKIFDISESPISGGSYVIYSSREVKGISEALKEALLLEDSTGVYLKSSWENFAKEVSENLAELKKIFESEKNSRWIAFGASARSSTLLNSIGDSSKCLNQIADNNPLKQGKYSPGIKLQICDPPVAIDSSVEKVFICAFNFEEEIITFLKNELHWNGEIILPLPHTIRRFRI
jgi:SAM-dependent methyltransferase